MSDWSLDVPPLQEQQMFRDFDDIEQRLAAFNLVATPSLAQVIGNLGDQYSTTDPSLLASVGMAVNDGVMTANDANRLIESVTAEEISNPDNVATPPPSGNWWNRLVSGVKEAGITGLPGMALRGAVKYGASAAYAPFQVGQNLIARTYAGLKDVDQALGLGGISFYQAPEAGGFDLKAMVTSTDLGALLTGRESGDGFFVGGAAREYQELKVAEYRGGFLDPEGNLVPFTPGRMFAGLWWQPGEGQFNTLSGGVDALIALRMPSPRSARAGRFGERVQTVAENARYRQYAGLTRWNRPYIVKSKVERFLNSADGGRLKDVIANEVVDIESAIRMFKGPDIDLGVLKRFVEADDTIKAEQVLRDVFELNQLTMPSQLPGGRFYNRSRRSLREAFVGENGGVGTRNIGDWRRLTARALDDTEVDLSFANEKAGTKSLGVLIDYMDMLRIKTFSHNGADMTRNDLLKLAMDHTLTPNEGTLGQLNSAIGSMLVEGLMNPGFQLRFGASREATEKAVKAILSAYDGNRKSVYGSFFDDRAPGVGFVASELLDPTDIFRNADGTINVAPTKFRAVSLGDGKVYAIDGLPGNTAEIAPEMMKEVITLPNYKQLRRATGRFAALFEKNGLWARWLPAKTIGDPNSMVSFMMWTQNNIWRRMNLITGGYSLRNLVDSTMSANYAEGIQTGLTHPGQLLGLMTNRRNKGSLMKFWDEEFAETNMSELMKESRRVVGEAARDIDPVQRARMGRNRGIWAEQQLPRDLMASGDVNNYVRGWAESLQLTAQEELVQLLAKGIPYYDDPTDIANVLGRLADDGAMGPFGEVTSIKSWLEGPVGQRRARVQEKMWTGRHKFEDPTGEAYDVQFFNPDGTLNDNNWQAYLNNYLQRRISHLTAGQEGLLSVLRVADDGMSYVRVPRRARNGKIIEGEFEMKPAWNQITDDINSPIAYGEPTDDLINELRRVLDEALADPTGELQKLLPQKVKFRVKDKDLPADVREWWDGFTNHWFSTVHGMKDATLNRSPAYRQFYYSHVDDLMDELNPEDARAIINRLSYLQARVARDYVKDLAEVRTRDFGGVTKYRVPDSFDGFSTGKTPGRWVTRDEYDDIVQRAKEQAKRLSARRFTEDDFVAMLNGTKDDWEGFTSGWAKKYLGTGKDGAKRWQRLVQRANTKFDDNAKYLSWETVDELSKATAIELTRRSFYDAASRSNLTDLMTNVMPFIVSWQEVMRRYSRHALADANRFRQTTQTLNGIASADPDGDGRGFFYRDPNTGELMFNFPMDHLFVPLLNSYGGYLAGQLVLGRTPLGMGLSGAIGAGAMGALSARNINNEGLDPELVAPVKSLSMGFSVLPGFGPVVQMAATHILKNKPNQREILDMIAPMGAEEFSVTGIAKQLSPAWADRVSAALANGPRSNEQYASMAMETMRALAATGEYDLSDPASVQQLVAASERAAKRLMALQALSQFTGPVRPSIEFDVPVEFQDSLASEDIRGLVENGKIPSQFLASIFRSLQQDDFDTAVPKMMEMFGPHIMLYMAPLTSEKEGVKGLGVSTSFGEWEGQNRDYAERHPDVYGYFAPAGSDFDYQTYLRQLRTGQRIRQVDQRDLIEDAQAVVGKALYRQFRRQQGMQTSPLQQQLAAEYRNTLAEAYPGFGNAPMNIAELDATINKLQQAAFDPAMANNESAIAARKYFTARDRLIQRAMTRRFHTGASTAVRNPLEGDDYADLRMELRFLGERLAREYPMFERVWSRELFDEVDL